MHLDPQGCRPGPPRQIPQLPLLSAADLAHRDAQPSLGRSAWATPWTRAVWSKGRCEFVDNPMEMHADPGNCAFDYAEFED